jgi:hypothetical protein
MGRHVKNKAIIIVGFLLIVLAAVLPGCERAKSTLGLGSDSDSLLYQKRPVRSVGVRRDAQLTDNVVAPRGDFWKSELTAIFSSSQSFADWDLGQPTHIAAAYVQGDNNDTYAISISDDGKTFRPLWEGRPVGGGGLQPRYTDTLDATARYVRVMAFGGDGSYALSEVQVFSQRPDRWPPNPTVRDSIPPDEVFRNKTLALGLALAVAVIVTWNGAPLWWLLLVLLVPAAAAFDAWRALSIAWPPGNREVALVRGVVAAVGCLTVIREVFAPAGWRANRNVALGVYGACAALAIAAFYNLGHPQFHDYQNDRPGFVHNFDMRVYFPIAKYFKELRFDGLYLGSVAAYVDDGQGVTLDSLKNQQLRSLKTHRMVSVGDSLADIKEVRSRFTPERWEEFKRDMRYFRENMGVRDYLGSMSDHGGNATPVWFLFGYALFHNAVASNATLTRTAMLDPILLVIALALMWRAFGIRTALISAIIFGANDFYMFGTCWAGATLRHDWLAYMAMGISLLKLKRWYAAGAIMMLSGLIRAFPFFMLVGAALPPLWWVVDHVRANHKLPGIALFREQQKPVLQVAAGAAVVGVTLWLASSLLFGFHSWVEWLHKVSMLQRDPHVNHVSLRALIAGPDAIHNRVLAARTNIFVTGIAAYSLMVLAGTRGKSLAFAATLATLMIPVVFHPANYYIHFIFVLPMLVTELADSKKGGELWPAKPADAAIWIVLLLLCAAEYGAAIEKDLGLHFYFSAALLMVAVTAILLSTLVKDYKLAQQLVPVPAGAGGAPVPTTEPPDIPAGEEPDEEKPPSAGGQEPSAEGAEPVPPPASNPPRASEPPPPSKPPAEDASTSASSEPAPDSDDRGRVD